MSELEQITQIIKIILSSDNDARKRSEDLLQNLRDRDFNQYIITFTNLLKTTPESGIKVFCLVHLRRLLSDFIETNDGKWHILSGDTQEYLKELLLEMLKTDQNTGSRQVLCDFIGDLAATIQCLNEERKNVCGPQGYEWNNLMQTLWGLLSSEEPILIESALKIMSVLFVHCGQNYANYKDELISVLKQTLVHPSSVVNVSSMEAVSCYLEHVKFKDSKEFMQLMPLILSQTLSVARQNELLALNAMAAIADILDTEPKMLKKNYKDLIELCGTIIKSNVMDGLKHSTLETLVLTVESFPKTLNKDINSVKNVAEIIFTYMVSSDKEPEEEWLSPPDGFVDNPENDDESDSTTKFCMALINRIIKALDKKKTLSLFSELILEMVRSEDWRCQHSALMSLSQVGEYIDDLNEFDPIVQFILNFVQSNNPKVRYAALHCLGQNAEDCRPTFQARYATSVLPSLLNSLNDNVPRVVYHTLNALTNFLEGCPQEVGVEVLPKLLEPCLIFLSEGRSYIREVTLTAIGSLADSCGQKFIPYWKKTAEAIFTLLNTDSEVFKVSRGEAIETITLLGEAVGKFEFKKVCHPVIEKMVEIQSGQVDKLDPQTHLLLSSWHRISSLLQNDFIPYLNLIMPSTFKFVEDVIQAQNTGPSNNIADNENAIVTDVIRKEQGEATGEDKGLFYNVNTGESDDVITAVKMMRGFASDLTSGYLPYLERTSEIFVHLIENSGNENVRKYVAESFPDLINVVQSSNHPDKANIIRNMHNSYIRVLWETVWTELDPEMMKGYLEVMMDVLTQSERCMTEDELTEFNNCILKTLKLSNERKNDIDTYHNENQEEFDDDDDEGEDPFKDSNKLEEELHLSLADLIGVIFKVYKEQSLPLVQLIYHEILPNALNPEQTQLLNKFGLFLIDDMIEHLGVELIPNEWPHLSEALLKYATHPAIRVRHAAIYGIGCLGEKSNDAFKDMSNACMKVLYEGLEMKKMPDEDSDEYGSTRDNIIASVGKIIKSQHAHISLKDTINLWVNNLPLKYDLDEAIVQHELLADIILESDASLVFGDNGENFAKVIKILAEVVNTRSTSEGFTKKVRKVVNSLMKNETTKALLQDAVSKLDTKLQTRLQNAIGS